ELRKIPETLVVALGELAAALDLLREVLELEGQNRGLEVVETGVETPNSHHAVLVAPMITEHVDLLSHLVVVRDDSATVAEAAQQLSGVKAEGAGLAEGTGELS